MARAIITDKLSETLRSFRVQNKIPSKELALYIGKSPAYITQIENGTIKSIDTCVLRSILEYITRENDIAKTAERIYESFSIKYSSEEMRNQLWLYNFDTTECLIPIPEGLIDEINTEMDEIGISREYLLSRINANEMLSQKEIADRSLPINEWYKDDENHLNAKIEMNRELLDSILDKKKKNVQYIFVLAISFYLTKIEKYGEKRDILNEENVLLMQTTRDRLINHRFLSLNDKYSLLSKTKSQEEYNSILNSFDIENFNCIKTIISGFEYASHRNVVDTNKKLKQFCLNMQWDLGYMLKLVSLEFDKLEKVSVTDKKKMLEEIDSLINRYIDVSANDHPLEIY